MKRERVVFTETQWNTALNQAQKTIPLYDLPYAINEFTRMLMGLRA